VEFNLLPATAYIITVAVLRQVFSSLNSANVLLEHQSETENRANQSKDWDAKPPVYGHLSKTAGLPAMQDTSLAYWFAHLFRYEELYHDGICLAGKASLQIHSALIRACAFRVLEQ
jgi:hypothetical protein